MLLPVIMLSLCVIGGAALFLFLKFKKGRAAASEDAAARAAHEFVNVRDIRGNLLYTQDGKALCYTRVSPISVDLHSKREQQALSRSLTAEMSGNQDEFQFLAVSRPVDISPLLTELSGLLSTHDRKQKELLRHEITDMNEYAISGDIVERQFYTSLWDDAGPDVERELVNRTKRFALNFTNCGVGCELLSQQEIVRLCNLISNPAYSHLEDSDIEPAIPILTS